MRKHQPSCRCRCRTSGCERRDLPERLAAGTVQRHWRIAMPTIKWITASKVSAPRLTSYSMCSSKSGGATLAKKLTPMLASLRHTAVPWLRRKPLV